MKTHRRSGFTLVEMLVVVAIIGILAAILVPAVWLGIIAANNAQIAGELAGLTGAIEDYKRTVHGQEYPPNFTTAAVVNGHIQRKFGRYNPAGSGVVVAPTGLDAAEALVFWLQGYGPNPKNPLAAPRQKLFNFDETRLKDKDGDGFPEYYPRSQKEEAPYVYFRADNYGGAYAGGTTNQYGLGHCKPYRVDTPSGAFANATSFQIICAGLDGNWGNNSTDKRYTSGANYNAGDRDNIANFSEGATLGDKL